MRAAFHRFCGLFGFVFSCMCLVGLPLMVITTEIDAVLTVLIMLALGLAIVVQFQIVRIDESGISGWRILTGRRKIRWEDVREIGIGGPLVKLPSFSRRDLAYVYVSTRALTDDERRSVRPLDKTRVVFPYLNWVAPRSGSSARCREALCRYYPGELPAGLSSLPAERTFSPTYVTREKNGDGAFTEVHGTVYFKS